MSSKVIESNNKCLVEGYNKAEVDALLANKVDTSNVYVKGDFAVITGTIEITNGVGIATFDYPTGYDMNNCVPISGITKYSNSLDRYASGCVQSSFVTGMYLQSNRLAFVTYPFENGVGPTGSYDCKVTLMKIS